MTIKRSTVSLSLFCALALSASTAWSAPSTKDRNAARKLGRDAKTLAFKGKYQEAAEKYEQADELYPAPSYKVQLVRMLTKLDDLKRASEVATACTDMQPKRWGEKVRHRECKKLLKGLAERTPTLSVVLVGKTPEGATILVDGEEVESGGPAVAYNPGTVKVRVDAPGYPRWEKTISLSAGSEENVEVRLEAKAESAADGSSDSSSSKGMSTTPAFVAWGVGAAGIGFGIGFGVAAFNSTNDAVEKYGCANSRCPAEAEEELQAAKANGNISTGAFIVGGVGAVTGTILYLLSGDDDEPQLSDNAGYRLSLEPQISPHFLGVKGAF